MKSKFAQFDTEIIDHEIWNDDDKKVTASILKMISEGADIVCCTGGMSVDPDDKTPLAIKNTGARIVSYGAPVLPGAMFLLAYYTVTEGDDEVTKEDLASLGEGGLCLNCPVCTFPNCGFGKGK